MRRGVFVSAALAVAGVACFAVPAAVGAQAYPSKPITLISPFPPGVTGELLFRGLAESASKHLG